MSSNSGVVDTSLSMIVVNPDEYPNNQGHTVREDSPTTMLPILAYSANNIMPTALGYKSFFREASRLELTSLPALTQKVFIYQSTTLWSIAIAVGEYGIKVAKPVAGSFADWETVVDTSASAVVDVRRLWTTCVIANKVYLYQQGSTKFYAIVDQASYNEAATPTIIVGATRSQVWNKWDTGILSYIPNFINMAGQIGLFRGKNRLGFWDSENAVAWSSAVAIEDFKPDSTTFAGVTKFVDVQGRIVLILGSGDGFIIYATRSIVLASELQGSPERWKGSSIMSSVGVAFDTQIAATQPDQIQFCITQAGLLQISNGNPEYIATEVMDFLAKTSKTVSLFIVEGRYIFLSTIDVFPGSEYKITGELLTDHNGNQFLFPKPVYPTTFEDKLDTSASGNNGFDYDAFGDYEPIVPVNTVEDGKNLIPCYDIKGFDSTWANTAFASQMGGTDTLISKINGVTQFFVDDFKPRPVVTVNSYYTDNVFEKAGDAFIDEISTIFARYTAHLDYQDSYLDLYATLDFPVSLSQPAKPTDEEGATAIWDNEVIDEDQVLDFVNASDLKLINNECRFRAYWDKFTNIRVKYKFTGNEEIVAGPLQYLFMDGLGVKSQVITGTFTQHDSNGTTIGTMTGTGTENTNSMPTWVSWTLTPALAAEINAYKATKAGVAAWDSVINVNATDTHTMDMVGRYLLRFHPEVIANGSHPTSQVLTYMKNIYSGDFTTGTWEYYDSPTDTGVHGRQFSKYLHIGCSFELGTVPKKSASVFIDPGSNIYGERLNRTATDHTCSTEDAAALYPFLATKSYANTIIEPFYYWDDLGKAAVYTEHGYPSPTAGAKIHTLVGSVTAEYILEDGTAADITLYDAELTGWGYYPTGGFSFRKTHTRHSSTTCPMPRDSTVLGGKLTSDGPDQNHFDQTIPPYTVHPPVNWNYPDAIVLPPNYALFQKGSISPYYPTYKNAAVYDMLLQKWGVYSNEHKHIYELMPVNRIDNSIMPVSDNGMFAGALTVAGDCTIFEDGNPNSFIIYGKFGWYRRGMSLATEVRAHFGQLATGYLIVESSMDGVRVDPSLSYTIDVTGQRNAILTFTRRAKWFNIRVQGNFNLTYLEFLAESRGRR